MTCFTDVFAIILKLWLAIIYRYDIIVPLVDNVREGRTMTMGQCLFCNSKILCEETNDLDDPWERTLVPSGVAIYWNDCEEINRFFTAQVKGGKDDGALYEVDIHDLVLLYEYCQDECADEWEREYTLGKLDKLMAHLVPAEGWEHRIVHQQEPDWYVKFYYQTTR